MVLIKEVNDIVMMNKLLIGFFMMANTVGQAVAEQSGIVWSDNMMVKSAVCSEDSLGNISDKCQQGDIILIQQIDMMYVCDYSKEVIIMNMPSNNRVGVPNLVSCSYLGYVREN